MIVKSKFYCKSSSKTGSGLSRMRLTGPTSHPIDVNSCVPEVWIDKFIEGKWYDGEYETWSWEDGYRVNGGWRKYWVVNESGDKEEISRAIMNIVFELGSELRNIKIDEILK